MGILLPNLGNANYWSAGQMSPLLNDPGYRTISVGRESSWEAAWATAIANAAKSSAHVEAALELSEGDKEIRGVVVVVGDRLGARGQIRLVPLNERAVSG